MNDITGTESLPGKMKNTKSNDEFFSSVKR
jgi:transcription termination factor Rho